MTDNAPSPRLVFRCWEASSSPTGMALSTCRARKLAGLWLSGLHGAPGAAAREAVGPVVGSHFDAQAKRTCAKPFSGCAKCSATDALESDGEVVSLNPAAVLCRCQPFEALVREGSRDA